ncbi:hypothetical protein H4R34_006299 [Dimargaris verticillata]|uniref:Mitochondrial carrier domain-containing protein n=1 Tax=Dimargaris verticillata TaxID=2761393 RepID=A0A9W8ATQ9_9FUNG|nr:hypothetical protein H4R34_006299 [Dimargaris verticillata]
MLAPLAGVSAVNAVLFAVYSRLKDAQRTHSNDPLTLFQIALAGAGAGIANTALISPVELLKIRLQGQYTPKVLSTPASAPRFHGPWDVARALYQSHGFRAGIMRGFWITLIREIPANMGFYTGFEAAKRFLTPTGSPPDSLSVPRLLLSGSFGGVCYWTCCYPLDVIKSTVQFQTFSLRSLAYIPNVAKSLYREQGARVFVRGYTPTLLRGLPAAATTFMVYEMTVRTLQHW